MKNKKKNNLLAVFLLALLCLPLFSGCTKKDDTIRIYTSIYKEVVEELEKPLKQAFPELKIEFFQGGSEVVANKISAEMLTGKIKADLILTSDPFWYHEMHTAGKLLPYVSPMIKGIDPTFIGPDSSYVCVRLPVAVIAYNPEVVKEADLPNWDNFLEPKYKDRISTGSPLESGTAFTLFSLFYLGNGREAGFEKLRESGMLASGGNSSVINRIETKEKPIGFVLLENVLKAQQTGSPIKFYIPKIKQNGVFPILSPIAISKDTAQPEKAKEIYDWFFGEVAQKIIVEKGLMYSPLKGVAGPPGAPSPEELGKYLAPWSSAFEGAVVENREKIKRAFSEKFLRAR